MKVIWSFLILVCWGLNYSYGQTNGKISLPVLKENAQIDSLITKVMSDHNLNHSSIMLLVNKSDGIAHFFIHDVGENEIIYYVSQQKDAGLDFGYFKFKGLKVLVNYRSIQDSFSKTPQSKIFAFIPDNWELGLAWGYKYQNGRFAADYIGGKVAQ